MSAMRVAWKPRRRIARQAAARIASRRSSGGCGARVGRPVTFSVVGLSIPGIPSRCAVS